MQPRSIGARIRREDGIAMIVTLMVLVLVSALMAGFTAAVIADQRAGGLDRDQTQAYAAAHAGLEQLTADLSTLFATKMSPTGAEITALTATPPALPNFTFIEPGGGSGYRIEFEADQDGNPKPENVLGTTIAAGPYQGLRGIITPYSVTVTARTNGGTEVRMRRSLQTVQLPVFQFGMFSESDLGFHSGTDFEFGGRVHTNGTLYLSQGGSTSSRLTLSDRVTAVKEIIRTHLMNGYDGVTDYRGTVRVIRNAPNNYRNLARNEGSLVTNDFLVLNEPLWTSLSVGTYASNIRNGRTGARALELPLVSQGAKPIDIIRRPAQGSNEDTVKPAVYEQRFHAKASLRILLSDTAAAITSLPGVTAAAPVDLSVAGTTYLTTPAPTVMNPPLARSVANIAAADGTLPANVYKAADIPLIGGFIKVDMQRTNGTWVDVTQELLALGIAGRNLADRDVATWNKTPDSANDVCDNSSGTNYEPNKDAVIRLQRVRDVPFLSATTANRCGVTLSGATVTAVTSRATDYWPLTLYDPREGLFRESSTLTDTDIPLGGLIHYIELDMNNLRRWFAGQIGSSGTQAHNDNGFIVYFSDRRTNRDGAGNETGEYGFEDFVNPADAAGTPNNTLDGGENLNAAEGNTTLETYGMNPVNPPGNGWTSTTRPWHNAGGAATAATARLIARANAPIFFRRALKLVNGGLFTSTVAGNCSPAPCNNLPAPGITVASENPVYVQGNFNATSTNTSVEPHVAASIIADAVTLLSNDWNDIRSFTNPHDADGRSAATTGYRMGVISGKSMPFARPTLWSSPVDFGSDGGAHNFLRYIENWDGDTLNYRGSFVSFFTSRQAVGVYKYLGNGAVYAAPTRAYAFDTDFLLPSSLPPGTPMFRDVNTLTFRQLLRPTQ